MENVQQDIFEDDTDTFEYVLQLPRFNQGLPMFSNNNIYNFSAL